MQVIHSAKTVDTEILAFDARDDGPRSLDHVGVVADIASAHECHVELATGQEHGSAFRARWRELVLAGDSPQKIYQSPEFFDFLAATRKPGERIELLSLIKSRDGVIAGVVPVRISTQDVAFTIGPFRLFKRNVEMINLLGSIPAIATGEHATGFLVQRMLEMFPQAEAVFMHAVPSDSNHWKQLQAIAASSKLLATGLLGQWRDCHTMPLPETFELYLEKFSSKKRYNLNRQIRQLSERAGALELVRVEQAAQVAPMMRGLESLLSPGEMGAILSETTFAAMADQGLLLSYILRAGERVVAAVIGTRSPDTLHIHNIFVDKQHLSLSIGTSVMHLAIRNLIDGGGFKSIDFGYGEPNNEFRSSHRIDMRAQVLVFKRTSGTRLLIAAHGLFHRVAESMIARAKAFRKKMQTMRKSSAA